MGVLGFIAKKKEQFRDATVEARKELAYRETEKLERERKRQAELAKALGRKAVVQKDVERISGFTEKHRVPSRMERLGKGLAKHIEGSKAKAKSRGSSGMRMKVRAPQSSGSTGLSMEGRDVFSTGSNLDTGGRGLDFGPKKKK